MENTEIENMDRRFFHCWAKILHPNDPLETYILQFHVLSFTSESWGKKIPEITLYIQVQPPREQNKNINKQCLSLETHEYKKPESLFLNDLMKYFYSRGGRKVMLQLLLQFRNWVKNKDFFKKKKSTGFGKTRLSWGNGKFFSFW